MAVRARGAALVSAAIGLLITVRLRGHPIGWLLLANAVLVATSGVAQGYAEYAGLEDPGALPGPEWAVLWDQSAWPLLFGVILAIILLFPDGRLPSRRARWVAVGGAASVGGFLILSFFDPEPFEAPYANVDRPLPGLPDALGALWLVVLLGILASLVAGVTAVRGRFSTATGIERLQLRWLVMSALLVPRLSWSAWVAQRWPVGWRTTAPSTPSSSSCWVRFPLRSASRSCATASTRSIA